MERSFPNGKLLRLTEGDITRVAADAIANAANSELVGGGGVDGAIHRVGGPSIMRELDAIRQRIGSCPTGSAVATGAGALPAKWVFHAVGPVYRGGLQGEPALLASCYSTCLRLAEEQGASHITFPSISTGVYGYPIADAARIAIRTVAAHLVTPGTLVSLVEFVLFGPSAYDAYATELTALP